ncbi:putative trans-aconitate 3-methyltransferase [Helianthus annuus]|nr:putative trans-aconitate 3-methyltransferase [Helianthus annuus]KAJ0933148.1 putative trans-aconitate 3-methyltransferase [Helianthus annuus]
MKLGNTGGIDHRRMADLFLKQAKQYWKTRPGYPQQLFDFIASKTPCHDFVWDVGTGNGQAAVSLASIYKSVMGTDTSKNQLEFAPKIPNVRYECTSPNISMFELEEKIGIESSVDLVTVASALHWFDHDAFYSQVKWILKKPNGVFAAWCYTDPKIDDEFDPVFKKFYVESKPYWEKARGFVDDKYSSIKFPFDPVDGCDHTGPFEFETKQMMNLDGFFMYIRSWSAYQTAKDKGVELLSDRVIEEFRNAWKEDTNVEKCVTYPIYLRIGKAEDTVK